MRWLMVRDVVLASAVVVAMPSLSAAQASATSGLDAEQVRVAFAGPGYVTSQPAEWANLVLTFSVADPFDATSGRPILRVFVFADASTAAAAHRAAWQNEEARRGRTIAESDDRGPQLLTGYGLSVWRGNVAMVQASPPTDLGAFPIEPDCSATVAMTTADAAELALPDRVLPTTTVDSIFVELLEGML